jgi:hypothetical protein
MSQVNITLNTNTVDINTTNNQIVVTDPTNPTTVNITQPVTSVVEVITAGPQGPIGPPGPSGSSINTGSFVTTSSFNDFTSSYNTGSFTGSFIGNLIGTSSWATNALTASYLEGYISPFPFTGSAIITGSLAITGSLIATQGISGSFSGSGANLFDIPASGITGLNLSQIATGSVTASVSPGTGSFEIVSGSTSFLFVSSSGNVGIGTRTPTNVVEIRRTGTTSVQIGGNQSAAGSVDANLVLNVSNGGGTLTIDTRRNQDPRITAGGGRNLEIATTAAGNTYISNTSTGKLGVGYALLSALAGKVSISDTILASGSASSGSLLDLRQTWNTTGNPAAIRLNVTNTASGTTSKLLDLQVGGVSQVVVDKSGNTAIGLSTDTSTARLQVRGTGATSSTTALRVQNSSLTDLLTVRDDGQVTIPVNPIAGTATDKVLARGSDGFIRQVGSLVTNEVVTVNQESFSGIPVIDSLSIGTYRYDTLYDGSYTYIVVYNNGNYVDYDLIQTDGPPSNLIYFSSTQILFVVPTGVASTVFSFNRTTGNIGGNYALTFSLGDSYKISYAGSNTIGIYYGTGETNYATFDYNTSTENGYGNINASSEIAAIGQDPDLYSNYAYVLFQNATLAGYESNSTLLFSTDLSTYGTITDSIAVFDGSLFTDTITRVVVNCEPTVIGANRGLIINANNGALLSSFPMLPSTLIKNFYYSGYGYWPYLYSLSNEFLEKIDIASLVNTGINSIHSEVFTHTYPTPSMLAFNSGVLYIYDSSTIYNQTSLTYYKQGLVTAEELEVERQGLQFQINNISQIATGSVTASVSPSQFTVTSGSVTEFQVTGTGVTIGSVSTDTHRVTGSLNVTGSTTLQGNTIVTGSLTAVDTVAASGSLSGSILDLRQTWNTGGAPTAIKLNVTETLTNVNSRLLDFIVNGASLFSVSRIGAVLANSTITGTGNIASRGSSILTTNPYTITRTTSAVTGGTLTGYDNTWGIAPTTGTLVYNAFGFTGTINQTGGANGITRGLLINPTITSAADFRAIETVAGNNLLNSTSGNTYVGLSTNTGTARLQVRGTGATSATNTFLLQNSSLTNLLTVRDDGSTTLSGSLSVSGSVVINNVDIQSTIVAMAIALG